MSLYFNGTKSSTIYSNNPNVPKMPDPKEYRTNHRNQKWPSMLLPSEMTSDTNDRILLLYDASNTYCVFAINITFSQITTAKVEFYSNTTKVGEENISLTSGTVYQGYYESDGSYNYILLVIEAPQGKINQALLSPKIKINNVNVNNNFNGFMLEGSCRFNKLGKLTLSGSSYGSITRQPNLTFFSLLSDKYTASITLANFFYQCYALLSVPEFNVSDSGPVSTSGLFSNCLSLRAYPPIDTSKCTVTASMFSSCSHLETILPLDISKSTNTSYMFQNCYALKHIPPIDTGKSTTFANMFQSCYSLKEISHLDTGLGNNLTSVFNGCSALEKIPQLDTSSATNMTAMFNGCRKITTLPMMDTSQVTNMKQFVSGCNALKTIPLLDTSSVTDMSSMFSGCPQLKTIPAINTSSATNMASMFQSCSALEEIPLLDTSSATTVASMFASCSSLRTIPALDISSATNTSLMFSGCYSLDYIPLLDTSKAINMNNMFANVYSIQVLPALDCSKVTTANNFTNFITNSHALVKMNATGMKYAFNLSTAIFMTREEIVNVLNNLGRVTSSTTLTLGSTNLAKLSAEDKAIATSKGWTLA